MAAITKRQKIMAGIMCLAGGAFVWDHVSSAPAAAPAAEPAQSLLVTSSTPAQQRTKPTIEPSSLGSKLAGMATGGHFDPATAPSAFSLPENWPTLRKVEVIAPAATKPSQVDLDRAAADEFIHRHHLDAIMVRAANSDNGIAIIDGQSVSVGRVFDRFKLVSVSPSAAVFRRGRVQMEMRIASESRLKRDGSIIADTTPTVEE